METVLSLTVDDNASKALLLAKTFFLPPPPLPPQDPTHQLDDYPDPLPDPLPITANQIKSHIANLPPFKAHGLDGIPNIVLKECSELLTTPLTTIFKAILEYNTYYDPWNVSITVVLRKPGKPSYEIPKAYHPIALLSTLAKLLTAIIAENLSNLVEQHQLLPMNHFRG